MYRPRALVTACASLLALAASAPAYASDDIEIVDDFVSDFEIGAVRVDFGHAHSSGAEPGHYLRLGAAGYFARGANAFAGVHAGIDTWWAPGSRGGGMSVGNFGGLRLSPLVLQLELGIDMAFDTMDHGGAALWAPFVAAGPGLELGPTLWSLFVRSQARWFFTNPAHAQHRFGLRVAFLFTDLDD